MIIQFEEFLKLVPSHYSKEDTIKFLNCLKPIFDYIDGILEETIGMKNIKKAEKEYLDYIGFYENVLRGDKNDEEYKPFILSKRFIKNNAPTTENLLKLVKDMTGFYPVDIQNNPNNEPASQSIKYVIPHTTDLSRFPDLNEICDAGARIYQSILLEANQRNYNSSFELNGVILKQNIKNITIPTA